MKSVVYAKGQVAGYTCSNGPSWVIDHKGQGVGSMRSPSTASKKNNRPEPIFAEETMDINSLL